MSNEIVREEFTAFDSQSSHPDIAKAIYITKRLEHVIRKYFCGGLAGNKRTPLGTTIKKYSYFGLEHEDIVIKLMVLVQLRNDLAHDLKVNTFRDEDKFY